MGRLFYYLSQHAFLCLADNHYVFLDLRSDEYLCLGRTHTDAFKSLLRSHVVDESSTDTRFHEACDAHSSAVVQALLEKGLLVEDEADGKPPVPPNVDVPLASMMERPSNLRSRIRPRHVSRFFVAAATASRDLRWQSIERTVRAVEARKLTHGNASTTVDCNKNIELLDVFRSLRPYYPRKYLCLFDSLALLHFLACFGIFPDWVFAVKLKPFGAHCWVQAGNLVVNDVIENVRDYTPIMSI